MTSQQPSTPIPANDDDPSVSSTPHPEDQHRNPYHSSSRWRHAESSAYARYEREHPTPHASPHPPVARDEAASSRSGGGISDLADFLNKSRLDPSDIPGNGVGGPSSRPVTPRFKPVVAGAEEARAAVSAASTPQDGSSSAVGVMGVQGEAEAELADGRGIACGPLLNYRRTEGTRWVGSVLVVVAGGGRGWEFVPRLELRRAEDGYGGGGESQEVDGVCLYSDPRNTFWRFDVVVEMRERAARWAYELPGMRFKSRSKPQVNHFYVPALDESMRIMFHSCNGFSVGTDEEAWSGLALWNDVARRHQERPFHVM